MDCWHRLIDYWRSCGLDPGPGVDSVAIRAFEAKYRVTLPADLVGYFSAVDGFGDEMDPDLYRFWPLAELQPVHEVLTDVHPDRFSYPGCFVFADYCISCWDYAVRISEGTEYAGPVFRVTGASQPGEQMAASFVEFIEKYLADPNSIV